MERNVVIKPFSNCPALDGYHCQTNSLAKIFHHYGHPLSEDMILGLGAGMGFIYWKMKMDSGTYVFIGGRGNNKNFFSDLGKRTGVEISTLSTMSAGKAEASLLEKLAKEEPVMMFEDMGLLPWFELPEGYHFGGHTFVVCGFDGKNTVLASDMEQKTTGLKKGFYHKIMLEQLCKARGSTHKPFPPKNTYLEFDFGKYRGPRSEDLISALKQMVESQLNPPIKNLGVKGIRYTANEILKWPQMFVEKELRMNLFNLYIYIEIGATGGGCFRYMYSRFLKETANIVGNKALDEASTMFDLAGRKFTEIGLMFENAEEMQDTNERLSAASETFFEIADLEENAYNLLEMISSRF
jgi:hypothetical protein